MKIFLYRISEERLLVILDENIQKAGEQFKKIFPRGSADPSGCLVRMVDPGKLKEGICLLDIYRGKPFHISAFLKV